MKGCGGGIVCMTDGGPKPPHYHICLGQDARPGGVAKRSQDN